MGPEEPSRPEKRASKGAATRVPRRASPPPSSACARAAATREIWVDGPRRRYARATPVTCCAVPAGRSALRHGVDTEPATSAGTRHKTPQYGYPGRSVLHCLRQAFCPRTTEIEAVRTLTRTPTAPWPRLGPCSHRPAHPAPPCPPTRPAMPAHHARLHCPPAPPIPPATPAPPCSAHPSTPPLRPPRLPREPGVSVRGGPVASGPGPRSRSTRQAQSISATLGAKSNKGPGGGNPRQHYDYSTAQVFCVSASVVVGFNGPNRPSGRSLGLAPTARALRRVHVRTPCTGDANIEESNPRWWPACFDRAEEGGPQDAKIRG